MSLVTRKPVIRVRDQVRLKPAAQLMRLARVFKFWLQQVEILYYPGSELQRRWSDCADAQADLRLCCSHMVETGFLMTWLVCKNHISWRVCTPCRYNKAFRITAKLCQNIMYHQYNGLTVYWIWRSTEFPRTLKFQYSPCYVKFSKESATVHVRKPRFKQYGML